MPFAPLPVDQAGPRILDALADRGAVVVVAPPGSGKTTRIPQLLADSGLLDRGACLVLEPRRLAARAAAQRVAEERGCPLGSEVGYHVRFDRRAGSRTRLLFVTEGILTARLQSDPFLEGVSAVILDEFHERSLEADLALAFLREIRREARPDLKLLVLSATLDPAPVAGYLGAEVVEASGRPHPVEVVYLEQPARSPLPETVAAGVRRAWKLRPGGRGDILVFLPGAGEIRAAARVLEEWASGQGASVLPLHGDLPGAAQDRVLRRSPGARVILATNVAETSITVEGVSAVVDTGLARVLRYDPSLGLDRLEVESVSRASAEQRAGRAGRLGPGVALRLWTRHDDQGRPERIEPEAHRADLSHALLEILAWGHGDARTFPWLEPPAPERVEAGLGLLARLGALDETLRLTLLGDALRRLPLPPRLGRLVHEAARRGWAREGARLAALAAERDLLLAGRVSLSGRDRRGPPPATPTGPSDWLHRLDLLEEAASLHFDSDRLRATGIDPTAARAAWRSAVQVEATARRLPEAAPRREVPAPEDLLRLALLAYPDRVARRRAPGSDRFVMVGGRGAKLAPESGVRREELVVAVRLEAGRRGERAEGVIRWASAVEPVWLQGVVTRTEVAFDSVARRVCAWERDRYDDLVIAERPARPDPEAARQLLAEEAARDPLAALRPGREARDLVSRWQFLAREAPELGLRPWGEERWRALLEELARGRTDFAGLRRADLLAALRNQLTWEQRRALEREAPERVRVPSGSLLRLEYPEEGPPVLPVKIQEAFGWDRGPVVAAGRVPVLLHLLGPHGRPLQVTSDLASFWRNTYPQVRKEMRGRYPRHRWPEDPWAAEPSRRTTQSRR
ncbi:MAG: ATP-dependent helicase HrpB [Deferrisomatales bacterium]